jgi:sulfate/thiosulfate transport system ATP-binding protein
MAIEVRNISKSFGATPVLEDISLDVQSGALTALLGPSGGGKSTLLRIIAGLETPDVGTVSILGQESTYLPPQRRNVGFVFQHYAAFKHLNVFRNVAFGLEVRKKNKDEIRKRVMELLELVHLDQFAERLPSQLSGGQRQRMALARALAVEPDVLLLDEPFGALDAQVRKELRAWLRRLHDEVHVTTVFVTHDQEEAIEISDDVVVLAGGKIIQSGSPAALYDHPKDEFVMRFLGPVTQLGGQLVRPHDLEISLEPASDATPAIVRRIVKLGFEVRVDMQEQGGGKEISAQLTRASSAQLDLAPGSEVYVRLTAGARSLQLAG